MSPDSRLHREAIAIAPTTRDWLLLLGLTIPITLALFWVRLPAAPLLGPMVAGILLAVREGGVRLPEQLFLLAQGLLGCLMAGAIPTDIVAQLAHTWPLFLSAVLAVIAAAAALGWLLTRWQVLGGTTAIWGFFPGAATTMMLMAESFGADIRLVAFMQYLRVILVAAAASIVARIWKGSPEVPLASAPFFPVLHGPSLGGTLLLAGGGALLARRLRIPAGPLLLPMGLGLLLKSAGALTLELPPWLLALAYALLGWSIGLRFTRGILLHALRALPAIALAMLTLIGGCVLLAAILVKVAGIDPLTAYLATSPGGADSVAIIAASSPVNVPFVMAMQIARFMAVLLLGPMLARWLASRARVAEAQPG
jgi:membrane AbrB-like protein